MDVFSSIARVEVRIAEITGQNLDDDQVQPLAPRDGHAGQFASMVKSSLDANDPAALRAAAPVAPEQIESLVAQNASTWQVDPSLVKAIMANESAFNANATSKTGAQGLMQLMPETAAGLGVNDAYDPAQNVAGGTRYIKSMLDRFGGDTAKAIAAYNAGPGAVEKYNGTPPYAETQAYVKNVLKSYEAYKKTGP